MFSLGAKFNNQKALEETSSILEHNDIAGLSLKRAAIIAVGTMGKCFDLDLRVSYQKSADAIIRRTAAKIKQRFCAFLETVAVTVFPGSVFNWNKTKRSNV